MELLHSWINAGNDLIWGQLLIYLLLGIGLFFTLRMGFMQIRLLPRGVKEMLGGRNHVAGSNDISSFQAFATGLASRVGTGNVAGVATAIALGGPGAVFWMWMTALLGMASAFAESSLAQLFKVSHHDNTFRGGPAYYIQKGLNMRWLGMAFSISLIVAFGLVFNAVQANSIVAATEGALGWDKNLVAIGLVLLTAPIIFGGLRKVGQVAEWMVPLMAALYLGMTVYVIITHASEVPGVLVLIVKSAFGLEQAAGGFAGYALSQAMMLGIKRGLFSNEAGMGSAPNAAAAATTRHPASQGLIQMFGVFIDTMIVCTCTALIVLLSGAFVPGAELKGVQLTQAAMSATLGSWGGTLLAVIMFLFCFSTIIGNYAYAEGNVEFIKNNKVVIFLFRLTVLGMVVFGCLGSSMLVWDMADLAMGVMALINLFAIVMLSKYVFVLLKDYQQQLKAGVKQPVFDVKKYPEIEAKIHKDVW